MPDKKTGSNLVGTAESEFTLGVLKEFGLRIEGDQLFLKDKEVGERPLIDFLSGGSPFDETKVVTDRVAGSVFVDRESGNIMMFR